MRNEPEMALVSKNPKMPYSIIWAALSAWGTPTLGRACPGIEETVNIKAVQATTDIQERSADRRKEFNLNRRLKDSLYRNLSRIRDRLYPALTFSCSLFRRNRFP